MGNLSKQYTFWCTVCACLHVVRLFHSFYFHIYHSMFNVHIMYAWSTYSPAAKSIPICMKTRFYCHVFQLYSTEGQTIRATIGACGIFFPFSKISTHPVFNCVISVQPLSHTYIVALQRYSTNTFITYCIIL